MDNSRKIPATCGLRDPNIINSNHMHWLPINLNQLNINIPTLVCLGGNGTITPRNANNYCRVSESLIGFDIERKKQSTYSNFNVVGFSYGRDDESETTGDFNSKDIDDIVNEFMLPRFFQNGSKVDLNTAKKMMSLVKFSTHCYGAEALNMIMSRTNARMLVGGYSKEEISDIFAQSFQLTYSPYAKEVWLPTVSTESVVDSLHRGMAQGFEKLYGHKLNGIEVFYDDKGMYRGRPFVGSLQPRVMIYTEQMLNTPENSINRSVEDGQGKPVIDEHAADVVLEMRDYNSVSGAPNADTVAKMMGYCMANEMLHAYSNSLIIGDPNAEYVDKQPHTQHFEDCKELATLRSKEELTPPN